jgi:hypothetical protein
MLAMPDTVPVRFRDCSCPGTPHPDGDVAELRPFLDYAGGAEALAAIQSVADDTARFAEVLGPVFIRRGVVGWNLLDDDGDPVPVTREALDALRWEDAYELADKADDLYGGQVLAPLVKRMSASSKNGRTSASTRPARKPSPKPRSPSVPSS